MPLSEGQESLIKAAYDAIDAVPRGTVEFAQTAASSRESTYSTFQAGLAPKTAADVASAMSPGVGDGARLTTIVAVTNDDRGVISPCGRYRQMMFDFYPDIQVIVRDGSELRVVGMTDLLPFAYKRVD